MAERLRAWLAGGHECDLDLGEGSAQDLMEKIENAGDRSWFSTADGCSRVRASAIVRIEVEGRPDTPHDPVERRSSWRGAHMPESGLPIRSMRNTTCGTSTTAKARPKTTPAGRRPRPQPTRSHRPKSAPWSSRNNDLVA